MNFLRSKQFAFGLAILFGIAIGFMTKNGVFQNLNRHTLVSAEQAVKTVAENPDKANPANNVVEGYTVVDKNTPFYVVETEENNNIKCAAGHYVDNKREGRWEFYYPTNAIKAAGFYKANQKDGMWAYYYPNGQVMSTGDYTNGVMGGTWASYYVNGNKKSEGQCVGKVQIGLWLLFPDESRQDRYWKGSFNAAGNMDGEWSYYENGEVIRTTTYSNGKPSTK